MSVAEDKYLENLQKNLTTIKNSAGYGSINPPKGLMEPDEEFYRFNLDPNGVRNKYYDINFRMLRSIAGKVAPITAVHTLRTMQIRPFSFKSFNEDETGFMIKLKDKDQTPSKKEKEEMSEIADFFLHSGYTNFPGSEKREEGMQEINEQLVRELLTIDQVALTLRANKKGKLLDFWILDGATIKRTVKDYGYRGDTNITFVQEVEGKIIETFTTEDILFYYSNRRTDIQRKGYGYSYIEQCLDMITAFLFGMAYNKEFFNSSAQPKGILSFEGDQLDQGQIEELQRQWVSMFRGVKGLWKTPFLQYNAKWQSMAPSNRDMEFNEYIQILSSWIFAIHGTDAAEVGMRLNQAQNVLNDNQEAKIAFSKSRALRDLLMSLSTVYNKIMERVPEWDKYHFVFTGLEAKDQSSEEDIKGKQVKTRKTLNEIRAEEDAPPLPHGDVVLDPQYIQHVQAMEGMKQENEQQAGEGEDGPGGEVPPGDKNGGPEEDLGSDIDITEDDLKNEGESVKKSFSDEFIEIIL